MSEMQCGTVSCAVFQAVTCTQNSETNPPLGKEDHTISKYHLFFYYILIFLIPKYCYI